MKKQNLFFIVLSIIVVVITFIFVKEIIPILKEKESKNRVFNDMQEKSYDAARGIVGIIYLLI